GSPPGGHRGDGAREGGGGARRGGGVAAAGRAPVPPLSGLLPPLLAERFAARVRDDGHAIPGRWRQRAGLFHGRLHPRHARRSRHARGEHQSPLGAGPGARRRRAQDRCGPRHGGAPRRGAPPRRRHRRSARSISTPGRRLGQSHRDRVPMSLRTALLPVVDTIRGLAGPTALDIRTYTVIVRTRTWSGGVIQKGVPTDTDLTITPPPKVIESAR